MAKPKIEGRKQLHVKNGKTGKPAAFPSANLLNAHRTAKLEGNGWDKHYKAAMEKLGQVPERAKVRAKVDPRVLQLLEQIADAKEAADPNFFRERVYGGQGIPREQWVRTRAVHPVVAGKTIEEYGKEAGISNLEDLGRRIRYDPLAQYEGTTGGSPYHKALQSRSARQQGISGSDVAIQALERRYPAAALWKGLQWFPEAAEVLAAGKDKFFPSDLQNQRVGLDRLFDTSSAQLEQVNAKLSGDPERIRAADTGVEQAFANAHAGTEDNPALRAKRERDETLGTAFDTGSYLLSGAASPFGAALLPAMSSVGKLKRRLSQAEGLGEKSLATASTGAEGLRDYQLLHALNRGRNAQAAAGAAKGRPAFTGMKDLKRVVQDRAQRGLTRLNQAAGRIAGSRNLGRLGRAGKFAQRWISRANPVNWSKWVKGGARLGLKSQLALNALASAWDAYQGTTDAGYQRIQRALEDRWIDEAENPGLGSSLRRLARDAVSIPEAVFWDPTHAQAGTMDSPAVRWAGGALAGDPSLNTGENYEHQKAQVLRRHRDDLRLMELAGETYQDLRRAFPHTSPEMLTQMVGEAAHNRFMMEKGYGSTFDDEESQFWREQFTSEEALKGMDDVTRARVAEAIDLIGPAAFAGAMYSEDPDTGLLQRDPAMWQSLGEGGSENIPETGRPWVDPAIDRRRAAEKARREEAHQQKLQEIESEHLSQIRQDAVQKAQREEKLRRNRVEDQQRYAALRERRQAAAEKREQVYARRRGEVDDWAFATRQRLQAPPQPAQQVPARPRLGQQALAQGPSVDQAPPIADNVPASPVDLDQVAKDFRARGVIRGQTGTQSGS